MLFLSLGSLTGSKQEGTNTLYAVPLITSYYQSSRTQRRSLMIKKDPTVSSRRRLLMFVDLGSTLYVD